jgi:hypothetical protein
MGGTPGRPMTEPRFRANLYPLDDGILAFRRPLTSSRSSQSSEVRARTCIDVALGTIANLINNS